jgi:hypothetical protein
MTPLIGYRVMTVLPPGFLRSLHQDWVWGPKEIQAAVCANTSHPAPCRGCLCGFNAYKTIQDCAQELVVPAESSSQRVMVRVNLWGRVHVYQQGYRAQYAYPVELIPSEYMTLGFVKYLQATATRYGITMGEAIAYPMGQETTPPQFASLLIDQSTRRHNCTTYTTAAQTFVDAIKTIKVTPKTFPLVTSAEDPL